MLKKFLKKNPGQSSLRNTVLMGMVFFLLTFPACYGESASAITVSQGQEKPNILLQDPENPPPIPVLETTGHSSFSKSSTTVLDPTLEGFAIGGAGSLALGGAAIGLHKGIQNYQEKKKPAKEEKKRGSLAFLQEQHKKNIEERELRSIKYTSQQLITKYHQIVIVPGPDVPSSSTEDLSSLESQHKEKIEEFSNRKIAQVLQDHFTDKKEEGSKEDAQALAGTHKVILSLTLQNTHLEKGIAALSLQDTPRGSSGNASDSFKEAQKKKINLSLELERNTREINRAKQTVADIAKNNNHLAELHKKLEQIHQEFSKHADHAIEEKLASHP